MNTEKGYTLENLARRCLELRVDFLDGDELDHELTMRKVFLTDQQASSMSRIRRVLRETIKQEKEKGLFSKVLLNSPDDEITGCIEKILKLESSAFTCSQIAPKFRSTLLHLANRLLVLEEYSDGDIKEKAHGLILRVLAHLNHFYGDDVAVSSSEDNTADNEDEFREDQAPDEAIGSLPIRKATSNPVGHSPERQIEFEFVEFFRRLGISSEGLSTQPETIRNVLSGIEKELKQLRKGKETSRHSSTDTEGTVVSVDSDRIRDAGIGSIASVTCTGTIPKATVALSVVSASSYYTRPITAPTVVSTTGIYSNVSHLLPAPATNPWDRSLSPTAVSSVYPTQPLPQFTSPYPSRPSWSDPQPAYHNPQVTEAVPQARLSQNQPPSSTVPYMNPWLSNPMVPATAGSGLPVLNTGTPAYRVTPTSRRTIPVSQWSIEKYSGTDQGMKLNEFLGLVEQLSLSEKIGDDELFDSAFHLFTGPAANWYMSMRSSGRLINWQHLVHELRKTFVHPELDTLVRSRIYQRRQQRNETFQEFYFDVDKMFRSMITPMDDRERLDILRRNLRSDYKKALLWKPVQDLPQLIEAGHLIDASNFSMYQKVFGTEKSVNMISQKNPPNQTQTHPRQKSSAGQVESWKSHKPKQASAPADKPAPYRSGDNVKTPTEPKPKPSTSQEGQPKPNRTLDFLVAGFKPPPMDVCLNCRQSDHRIDQCRNLKGLICYVCGFKGFDSQHCPYCRKNGLQTTENRRSSEKSA